MANLKVSEQAYPSTRYTEAAAPSTPAAGEVIIYAKADGLLYQKDDAGTETLVANSAAGALATDTLWDAAGDLVQGTGANTAAKLSAGTSGHVLTSNGAAAALSWQAPAGGGAVATDSIWDAAGDLVQGTGANTGAKLTAGLAGQTLRSAGAAAANTWAYPPGHEFDYVQITSPVNITASTEATANTIVTGNAIAYDGSTVVVIEFWAPFHTAVASANKDHLIDLYDGSSSIGFMGLFSYTNSATAQRSAGIYLTTRLTPSAATHTYSIRGHISPTSGTWVIGAGAGGAAAHHPAYIRIRKA